MYVCLWCCHYTLDAVVLCMCVYGVVTIHLMQLYYVCVCLWCCHYTLDAVVLCMCVYGVVTIHLMQLCYVCVFMVLSLYT